MSRDNLAMERQQHQRRLAETLRQIVATLSENPDVEQAILFGSYAHGRSDLFTDLDILVVMHSPMDFVTRTAEMYRTLSSSVDLDLFVYTPEELQRNRHRGLVRQALEKGRLIYEKRAA
jgi:predicted nucleotidyltransferase